MLFSSDSWSQVPLSLRSTLSKPAVSSLSAYSAAKTIFHTTSKGAAFYAEHHVQVLFSQSISMLNFRYFTIICDRLRISKNFVNYSVLRRMIKIKSFSEDKRRFSIEQISARRSKPAPSQILLGTSSSMRFRIKYCKVGSWNEVMYLSTAVLLHFQCTSGQTSEKWICIVGLHDSTFAVVEHFKFDTTNISASDEVDRNPT